MSGPATVGAPADGPGRVPAISTRDRVLVATEVCLRRHGLRRTTMVEVAEEAGISRAALYKHFPDKASLVLATLGHIDERFWSEAHRRVGRRRSLAAQVAEAVQMAREQEREVGPRGLMQHLRRTDHDELAALLGTGLREVLPGMAEFWQPYLERARDRGEVRADVDVARAAEWVMRMILSLVTVPGDAVDVDDPASVRSFLEDFLVVGLR
ncbi:TetR/AcrR family transcriptional regulator [Dermatobacter hominis]|uniref:TetR/AcrR family transcriptional regulator n=1 Tax=Dermatobacter hominis TaxID=2884263 RepID=UPI001D0F64E1|nr:TetR/AcrR family transcriptional regulator [Dermatobacter hominis]UDY34472.1 TetR/AcrR family transcriptional regulator [Dermatobacter hominis]